MGAEKQAILDELADMNKRVVALSERAAMFMFGKVWPDGATFDNYPGQPITRAIMELAGQVAVHSEDKANGR